MTTQLSAGETSAENASKANINSIYFNTKNKVFAYLIPHTNHGKMGYAQDNQLYGVNFLPKHLTQIKMVYLLLLSGYMQIQEILK